MGNHTLVFLHNVQVFRLLLKTSVESSTNELFLFLAGFTFAGEALSVCAKEILLLFRGTSQSRVALFVLTVPMFEAGV